MFMRQVLYISVLLVFGMMALPSASAQEIPQAEMPAPEIPAPDIEGPEIEVPELDIAGDPDTPPAEIKPEAGKNLTIRSEADRAEILKKLFLNLKNAPDATAANLVAEEVWAVFLQSGSASVDFVLLRGIAAQTRGDMKLARRMYDHVTRLQPDYAEGWSRSGRLAILEEDLNRAVADTLQSLILEPRHFYALWTLGNILETLGKQDAAFEAYLAAFKLYPEHEKIKERVEFLKEDVKGKAL